MVTYDQAVHFLEGVLRMPSTWRNLLHERPLEFLTQFIKRHAIRVPFQNAHMAAVEEGQRWFPSYESIITNGLTGRGGSSIQINYFAKLVLQAIGLDAFVVRGDSYPEPIPGSNCILMVNLRINTKDGGVYLVEVGGAYPILEPVPMNPKRLPYRTTQAVGFPYEFREIAPGWVGKFHLEGGIMGGKFYDRREVLRTYWEMQGRELWEFDYPMLEVFTKQSSSILLQIPYMHRFFRNTEFRRLFPELPENKEKVLVTKSKTLSEINKVLSPNGKPKVAGILKTSNTQIEKKAAEKQIPEKVTPSTNGKVSGNGVNNKTVSSNVTVANGKNSSQPSENAKPEPIPTLIQIGKQTTLDSLTLSKLELIDSDEEDEEYEVVTEEEVETDEEDDLDNPQNFVFAYKKRIVVGDSKTRKVIRDYDTYEEMAVDLRKFFPKIPPKVLDKAVKTFNTVGEAPHPFDSVV